MKTYTSKNLEELLKEAAADKGVNVEDLTYTILEETSGFLGLGSKVTASVYCDNDISLSQYTLAVTLLPKPRKPLVSSKIVYVRSSTFTPLSAAASFKSSSRFLLVYVFIRNPPSL